MTRNNLSISQERIVESKGNIIVRASAGTGKTKTLVSKIDYELNERNDFKTIAALTFTIKATKEIRERLAVDNDNYFVGTNNAFVIEEIIKPFIRDVYGGEYDIDITADYLERFNTFDEGMDTLKTKHKLGSLKDNKQNFIFQLALIILKKSRACKLYLKSKYFKIFIDEYQDCDKDMHDLFMFICDQLGIDLFVVGDEKQSIYTWRGAYPQAFINISKKQNFTTLFLRDNYRSCLQIQNYSNLLNEDTKDLYKHIDDLSNIILICTDSHSWLDMILPYINAEDELAVLRYKKDDAKRCAEMLTSNGIDTTYICPTPIDDIANDLIWFYRSLTEYFIIEDYSKYDLMNIIPNFSNSNETVFAIDKYLTSISNSRNIKDIFVTEVGKLAKYLGYEAIDRDIEKVYETINDPVYYPSFSKNIKHISLTIHSSKGLEFNQVILFADDYNLNNDNEIYNHYVASTRAKNKLIIVYLKDIRNSRNFVIRNILLKSNLKFVDIGTIIDKS